MKSEHSGVKAAPHSERPMGKVYEITMLPSRCIRPCYHSQVAL
jgi:hypothetical protein